MAPRTVLFLHGAPGRASDWDAVCALAPPTSRCVALTLPDNAADARATRLEDLEACAAAALAAVKDSPVTVVGHSLGGFLATRLATAPGVARLVLVASTDEYRQPLLDGVRAMVATLTETPAALSAVADAVAASWFPAAAAAHPARRDTQAFLRRLPAARLGRVGARIVETASRAPLPAWPTPTVVVHDEADPVIPLAWAEALVARLPHARLERLAGTGHVPHLLAPELVAAQVFADGAP